MGAVKEDQVKRLLDRLFGVAQEIDGLEGCQLYRWMVLQWGDHVTAYLNHFVDSDGNPDLHDHPRRLISIGLWGWYLEQTPERTRKYSAPWIRTFPATHIHRILVPSKNCWTLIIVFKTVREWGFWHLGQFIPWHSYSGGADADLADKRKACE